MADVKQAKRNRRLRREGPAGGGEAADQLSKEEKQVARYLRLKCPSKQSNLMGMKVSFFVGSKLVDALMNSEWGPKAEESGKTALFANRQACVNFMQRLMHFNYFNRATKIYKEQLKSQQTSGESQDTPQLRKRKVESDTQKSSPQATGQVAPKRKFKLELHDEQRFVDTNDPYVWIFEPTSMSTYVIGFLLILGAIGICLFPLWPPQVREGVYYLSITGASFLGAILGLAVLKYILFAIVWVATIGRVRFWLFPNLTEDVGFFESFVPVYTLKCEGGDASKSNETNETEESKSQSKGDEVQLTEPATTKPARRKSKTSLNEASNTDSPVIVNRRGGEDVENNDGGDDDNDDDDDFELVEDEELVAKN